MDRVVSNTLQQLQRQWQRHGATPREDYPAQLLEANLKVWMDGRKPPRYRY